MSAKDVRDSGPLPSSSWAIVASNGNPSQQQKPSTESWPLIQQPAVPRLDPRQEQITFLENQNQKLKVELKQAQSDENRKMLELEAATAKTSKMEKNLDNARKKFFSLQPPQDISDDQVKQAFDDLCHNIEEWVDLECEAMVNLETLFDTNDWTDLELRIAEHHITDDDIELSKEFPNIAPNIIMNAIFSFVYDCSLKEEKWCAWTDRSGEFWLNNLVDVMSMQKSVYNASPVSGTQSVLKFADNPQLRRWRSETFRALKSSDRRLVNRGIGVSESLRSLYFMLKHFAKQGKQVSRERLRSKIIEPAYLLADMIKASSSGYRFNFMVNSSSRDVYIEAAAATLHKFVDACTGTEEDMAPGADGRIGKLRSCIFPTLEKVQEDGERTCMSKALVVLDKLSETDEKSTTIISQPAESGGHDCQAAQALIAPVKLIDIEKGIKHEDHEKADRVEEHAARTPGIAKPQRATVGKGWIWDGTSSDQSGKIKQSHVVW